MIYNCVFCVRRFNIVFINVFFTGCSPLSPFGHNISLYKALSLMMFQIAYILYIMETKPHTESIYNKLELLNEGILILICYVMIVYSGVGRIEYIISAQFPVYLSLFLTACIVIANFYVMFRLTYLKIKRKIAASKLKRMQQAIAEENVQLQMPVQP